MIGTTGLASADIETIDAVKAFPKMLELPEIGQLDGIVVGRVDLTGSMGLSRESINDDAIRDISRDLLVAAKEKRMETAIGGGVSAHSLPFFRQMPAGSLDRYETRKVIFGCPRALAEDAPTGILKAVGFELLWLKNKRDYYGLIAGEDLARIDMLEKRYRKMIEEAGGVVE